MKQFLRRSVCCGVLAAAVGMGQISLGAEPPVNPLGEAPARGVAGFSGIYRGGNLTLTLKANAAGGEYSGQIVRGGDTFRVSARDKDGKLEGTFLDNGGNSFQFSASVSDEVLSFNTAGRSYKLALQRPVAVNPLAGDDPKEAQAVDVENSGGVGVALQPQGGKFFVGGIAPGGPAAKAGVRVGDEMVSVDGKSVGEFANALGKIRGKPGTEVVLGLRHGDTGKDYEVKLTRESLEKFAPGQGNNGPPPGEGVGNRFAKYQVIGESATGRAVMAAYENVRSAKAILKGTVGDLSQYFDEAPTVGPAFGDKDDMSGTASFTGKFKGRPVKGIMVASVGPKGGTMTVAMDSASAPPGALSRLLAAARPVSVNWVNAPLTDGSGMMRLPSDWKITSAAKGAVDAVGPDGQTVDLGLAFPVSTPEAEAAWRQQQINIGMRPTASGAIVAPYGDPAQSLERLFPAFSKIMEKYGMPPERLVKIAETSPVPYPNGKAAFIHFIYDSGQGNKTVRRHGISLVITSVTGQGQWLYYYSQVTAPGEFFQRDLPLMMEIWKSWKVSDKTLQDRMNKAMEDMKEAGNIYRRSTENAAKARDRSNADFDEVIRGYRTVEDTTTGERHETDLGWVTDTVQKLNEHAGYERYKEIPLRDQ